MRCAARKRSCQFSAMLHTCGVAHSWCDFPSQDYEAKPGGAASAITRAKGANVERDGATSVHENRSRLGDGLPAVLLRQLPALLRLAQPWHALTLAVTSVVEALLVARSEFPLSLLMLPQSNRIGLSAFGLSWLSSSASLISEPHHRLQPHVPGAASGANRSRAECEQPDMLVQLHLRT